MICTISGTGRAANDGAKYLYFSICTITFAAAVSVAVLSIQALEPGRPPGTCTNTLSKYLGQMALSLSLYVALSLSLSVALPPHTIYASDNLS